MDSLSIILIGVGLAMDCLAVSITQGLQQHRWCNPAIIMAILFGLFQGAMPLIGYYAGTLCRTFFSRYAGIIALVLLGWIGGKMIYESFHKKDSHPVDWSARNLIVLAIATSIDALATGVIFIPCPQRLWFGIGIIALCSFVFAIIGYWIGITVARRFRINVELIGGLILIAIGLKIFIEGLCS